MLNGWPGWRSLFPVPVSRSAPGTTRVTTPICLTSTAPSPVGPAASLLRGGRWRCHQHTHTETHTTPHAPPTHPNTHTHTHTHTHTYTSRTHILTLINTHIQAHTCTQTQTHTPHTQTHIITLTQTHTHYHH